MTLSTDNYKAAVAERSRIEHERDYDALTGLYSVRPSSGSAGSCSRSPILSVTRP